MVEQQASASEIVTTDPAASEETAPETQSDEAKAHKQLLDDHSQQGRELKAANAARVKAETRAEELEAENEAARYGQMNDEQKAEYRLQKDRQAKDAPKTANLTNENYLLKAIAQTSDDKIAKALSAVYWRSEAKGKFPDKDSVSALVEGLTPDDEEEDEPEKVVKVLAKVTPVRGTRGTEVSIDEELKAAEASVKAKDGKFTYGEVLGLRQRRDAVARQAR